MTCLKYYFLCVKKGKKIVWNAGWCPFLLIYLESISRYILSLLRCMVVQKKRRYLHENRAFTQHQSRKLYLNLKVTFSWHYWKHAEWCCGVSGSLAISRYICNLTSYKQCPNCPRCQSWGYICYDLRCRCLAVCHCCPCNGWQSVQNLIY